MTSRERGILLVQCYFGLFLARSTAFVNLALDRHIGENKINWLWPLSWLPQDISIQSLWLLFACLLILNLLVLFFPRVFLTRLGGAISVLLLGAAVNSFGHISHSDLGWVTIAFLIIALPVCDERRAHHFLRSAQALLLSTYFASGVWKLLSIAKALGNEGFFTKLAATLPDIIAHSICGEGSVPRALALFFGESPILSSTLWLAAVLFQLSTVIWLFKPQHSRIWGALIILFHATNVVILGFQFVAPILLATFLFFFWPGLEKASDVPKILGNRAA